MRFYWQSKSFLLPLQFPLFLQCANFYTDGKINLVKFTIRALKDLEGKPKVNHVTVFERPGLHEFLHQTSEFADLILFTAGLEGSMLLS